MNDYLPSIPALSGIENFSPLHALIGAGGTTGIAIDEERLLIAFWAPGARGNQKSIYGFEHILGAEIVRDGTTITRTERKGVVGRSAVGGLVGGLFGIFGAGVGAIIGGTTSDSTATTEHVTTYLALKVTVQDLSHPIWIIPIWFCTDKLFGVAEHIAEHIPAPALGGLAVEELWMGLLQSVCSVSKTSQHQVRFETVAEEKISELASSAYPITNNGIVNSKLFQPFASDDVRAVGLLLRGIPRSAIAENSYVLLWTALCYGSAQKKPAYAVGDWLIKHGADVHASRTTDDKDLGPMTISLLESAFLSERGDVVLWFLKRMTSLPVHYADPFIIQAAGKEKCIPYVIDQLRKLGANIEERAEGGITPLMEAARWGNVAAIKYLLSAGAQTDVVDNDGYSALSYALSAEAADVVTALTEGGADTACKLFAELIREMQERYSQRRTDSQLLIVKAVEGGDLEYIRSQSTIDLSGPLDGEGNTALMLAIFNRQDRVAEFLIEAGVGIKACSSDFTTPVHLASVLGLKELLANLLRAGASMSAIDDKGFTPLYWAIRARQKGTVQHLLSLEALNYEIDVDALLDLARESADPDILEMVLSYDRRSVQRA